jgi:hypothetical protein
VKANAWVVAGIAVSTASLMIMCKPRASIDAGSDVAAFNSAGRWIPEMMVFNYVNRADQHGALVAVHNAAQRNNSQDNDWQVSSVRNAPPLGPDAPPLPPAASPLPGTPPGQPAAPRGPFNEAFSNNSYDMGGANFPGFRCEPRDNAYVCTAVITAPGVGATQDATVKIVNQLPGVADDVGLPRRAAEDPFLATLTLAGVNTAYGCMIVNRDKNLAQCGLPANNDVTRPFTCRVGSRQFTIQQAQPGTVRPSTIPLPPGASPTPAPSPITVPAPAAGELPRYAMELNNQRLECFGISDTPRGRLLGFICAGPGNAYVRVDPPNVVPVEESYSSGLGYGGGYSYGGSLGYSYGGSYSYGGGYGSLGYGGGYSYAGGLGYSYGGSYSYGGGYSYAGGLGYGGGYSYAGSLSYGGSYGIGGGYSGIGGLGSAGIYDPNFYGPSPITDLTFRGYLPSMPGYTAANSGEMRLTVRLPGDVGTSFGSCVAN